MSATFLRWVLWKNEKSIIHDINHKSTRDPIVQQGKFVLTNFVMGGSKQMTQNSSAQIVKCTGNDSTQDREDRQLDPENHLL